ncbi:NADH dehydrogenase subunit J [Spirosomataceae bacterium TFI 002]|nr:NADH dehydrogenase subunit J [Spirosomataceae bacterium TFI 002]
MEFLETLKNLTMTQWSFYIVSLLTLLGGIGTVVSKNPMHSVIYLILTFFSLSSIYILLNAQFVAAVNIIVYAGAIMVLFLFVVMFLNLRGESNELDRNVVMIGASVIAGVIGFLLIVTIRNTEIAKLNPYTFNAKAGLIENLGKVMYSKYVLPFELVSVLFLVAMAGAVMLGKREKGERNF